MTPFPYSVALVALLAALLAVFGLIPKIDLPLGVPITLQNLGVMLAGCLLGPRRGLQAVLLFLGAVGLGLPLLSGGRGGLGVFTTPSVGYLLGWPLGALVTGLLMNLWPRGTPQRMAIGAFAASAIGVVLVHVCGVVGLMQVAELTLAQAILGTLVFVPGDVIKCALCAMVVHTVARGLPDWPMGGRPTALQQARKPNWFRELGLRRGLTRPIRPQTNGKADPFIQSTQRERPVASPVDTPKMEPADHFERFEMAYRDLLELPEHRSLEVASAVGILWLTQDNDLRDLVLEPGDRVILETPGRVLAYALDDAVLEVRKVDRPTSDPAFHTWYRSRITLAVRHLVSGRAIKS